MKSFKRISAIVLSLILLNLTFPVISVFADDTDMRYGRTKLDANWQYIYDKLVIGCETAEPEIKVDISSLNLDFDKFNDEHNFLYEMFYSDYPEYFWVNNGHNGAEANGDTLTLRPSYSIGKGTALNTAKSKYNSKVNELTQGLSGKSDYEKSKILHDRLAKEVEYVNTPNDQNAYGALVEGKAVCSGYARAYQHLMNKAGIPAWFVCGTSTDPSTNTSIGHAWNLVKLDGQWYYTDVTWDDHGENIFYEYLNITTSKMSQGHTLNSTYTKLVPQATATEANYYKKEGRELSGYDQSKLVNLLKKDNNKTQIYVNDNVDGFISSLGKNLNSLAKDLGASGNYTTSYSLCKLKNALIVNIVIISESHTHTPKTNVSQINASCLANGKKAYYICDCGLKFLDSACTQQITDDSQLDIKANAHTPSAWKNNASIHWTECTQCGSETANTRGVHSDGNNDYKCDTCGYNLPKPDSSGNIVIGGPTTNTTNTNSTSNSNQNTTTNNTVSSTPDDSLNESELSNTESAEQEDVASNESISNYEELYLYPNAKLGNTALKWILICGSVAAIVAAGITTTVILINKKKS